MPLPKLHRIQIYVSNEELQLITEMRKKNTILETKFRVAVDNVDDRARQTIKNINGEVEKLIKISEDLGVPFEFDISPMLKPRKYMPKSFKSKWKGINSSILSDLGLYVEDTEEDCGWEY